MPVHQILSHADSALSRNRGVITPGEQAALSSAVILIAGCGSVGGSALEPLVRLGALRFRLADPDTYELSNVNRQVCTLADLGKSKGSVLARRAQSINPHVQARVYDEGLTEENLDEALTGASVVFDGIDPEQSGWVKYQLHARSAARGIPVVAGYDFGGKPTLYVFDYRRDRRPFFGKTDESAHRDGRYRDAMRWLGYFHFSVDFLPVMRRGLRDGGTWPQVSYCVQGLGAITARTIVDLLMARPVRRVVSTDIHRLTQPYPLALASSARLPLEMLKTLVVANRHAQGGRRAPQPQAQAEEVDLPPTLSAALDGARLAPSRFDTQPWLFRVVGDDAIQVGWRSEVPLGSVGSSERDLACALGAAIEAIEHLAECQWRPFPAGWLQRPGSFAGELVLGSLRESELLVRHATLCARKTNRGKYLCDGVDLDVLTQAQAGAMDCGVTLEIIDRRATVTAIGAAVRGCLQARLRANTSPSLAQINSQAGKAGLAELAGNAERDREMLARMLALPAPAQPALGRAIAPALSRQAGEATVNSAAILAFTTDDDAPDSWVQAGRALMRVWLTITAAGYAAQPLHMPLDDLAGTALLKEAAGVDQARTLLSVLRVGRGLSAAAPSPRMPLGALLDYSSPMREPQIDVSA